MSRYLSILALVLSIWTVARADSGALSIQAAGTLSVNLQDRAEIPITVNAEGADLMIESVDAGDLAQQMDAALLDAALRDVKISIEGGRSANAKLVVTTRVSAPSFKGSVVLRARSGDQTALQSVPLVVNAVHVIDVTRDGKSGAYEFSSPRYSYYRPHAEGLKIEFRNMSDQPVYIHGSDAIPHQNTFKPALAPALFDAQGAVVKPGGMYDDIPLYTADKPDEYGSYTIHNVYEPSRDAVINASKIPAEGTPIRSQDFH